jgi:hypothetical protein
MSLGCKLPLTQDVSENCARCTTDNRKCRRYEEHPREHPSRLVGTERAGPYVSHNGGQQLKRSMGAEIPANTAYCSPHPHPPRYWEAVPQRCGNGNDER